MVRPERVAVTPESTWNTPTPPTGSPVEGSMVEPPLIAMALAPGPWITSGQSDSLSSSVLESVIVCGFDALKTVGSNSMTLPAALVLALAWVTAQSRSPEGVPAVG